MCGFSGVAGKELRAFIDVETIHAECNRWEQVAVHLRDVKGIIDQEDESATAERAVVGNGTMNNRNLRQYAERIGKWGNGDSFVSSK